MSVYGISKFFNNNLSVVEKPIYINIWQKPNGEFYVRLTKHRIFNSFNKYVQVGYVNSHGHKLIDVIKQYIDLYIEK